jgi:hypothetical protein
VSLPGIPRWAWITWLIVTLASFGVLEAVALFNDDPSDTLSAVIVWLPVGGIPVAFGLWFAAHFAKRGDWRDMK